MEEVHKWNQTLANWLCEYNDLPQS